MPSPPRPASVRKRGIRSIQVRQGSGRITKSSSASSITSVASTAARSRKHKSPQKLTVGQLFRLSRRLLVLAATIGYIFISLDAVSCALDLLGTRVTAPRFYTSYNSLLIAKAAGQASIRTSPLVVEMLSNNTAPRSGTLFIEKNASYFSGCRSVSESVIYQDTFQRDLFGHVVESLTYNLTFLDPSATELVMPVVDCSFTSLLMGDVTAPRSFFLVRNASNHDDVAILSVTIGVQEFEYSKHKSRMSAAIATIALVSDMRATTVEHHFAVSTGYPYADLNFKKHDLVGFDTEGCWMLKSVPVDPVRELPSVIATATPTGSYISSVEEQSTIVYLIWELQQDPAEMLTHWVWYGKTVSRDAWAWVHLHHLYFAAKSITGLLVLLLIVFYNFRSGRIWVGDAFVSASSTHKTRTVLVLLSWVMNHFWTVDKCTLYRGCLLSEERIFFFNPSIICADMFALYTTAVSLLGEVLKERIDPALTLGLFLIGFEGRLAITKLFPGMVKNLVEYANHEYLLGVMPLDPTVPERTPLRVWNSKPLPNPGARVIFSALFPIFSTLVFIVAYVACKKLYRWKYPDLAAQLRSSQNSLKEGDGYKSNLTQFEFATGVALRERFGVVSDYDNYVYIKGMRFASADGIYTSAFVIANGKFLVDIGDLLTIFFIKLTRVRFKNVYVYEVEGNSVKKTARLLYPETLSFVDLLHLNLKILL